MVLITVLYGWLCSDFPEDITLPTVDTKYTWTHKPLARPNILLKLLYLGINFANFLRGLLSDRSSLMIQSLNEIKDEWTAPPSKKKKGGLGKKTLTARITKWFQEWLREPSPSLIGLHNKQPHSLGVLSYLWWCWLFMNNSWSVKTPPANVCFMSTFQIAPRADERWVQTGLE